ncbi:hypothetical protein AYL99_08678 [Fonsecaea erecta]|uniref:Beta-lactamase-related domain-containing protein n=1 Tax=Fonsecaea erecta TaxID=1367422 RepID=A0A178ZDP6_9EURO|nr:hypothetical protein AYL99_08678 [Fonsecaea erecta]OAP57940.1 hypothetical protein AYL99_08678 [Fonsecaea erecta]
MTFRLSEEGATLLQEWLKTATKDATTGIPGVEVCVVNRQGQNIFQAAHGRVGASNDAGLLQTNSIFWLASASKLVLSIACMQLVEKALLSLDDADQVEQLCPRLKDVHVVQRSADGSLSFEDKKGRITLRMLMNHTAGFGYKSYSPEIRDWVALNSTHAGDFSQPLVAHPGTAWNYGFNNEWVSLMIEAASGERMEAYVKKHISEPLGLKDISLFPNGNMKARLAQLSRRSLQNGRLEERPHFIQAVLDLNTADERERAFQNAAGGFFSSPADYCAIIATLLNGGASPVTGARILQPSTVDAMFENQIPEFPNFARQGIPAAVPDETYPIAELYPAQPHHLPQGWGLSFMLTLQPTVEGRGPGTGSWAGMANCYWWADRIKGVGGFIGTQILPFAGSSSIDTNEPAVRSLTSPNSSDPVVISLCRDIESIVYANQASD